MPAVSQDLKQYYRSPWWQRRRDQALREAGYRCEWLCHNDESRSRPDRELRERCCVAWPKKWKALGRVRVHMNDPPHTFRFMDDDQIAVLPPIADHLGFPLHVHHKHYRTLGRERRDDLQVLCGYHHIAAHIERIRCEACQSDIYPDPEEAIDSVMPAIDLAEFTYENSKWSDLRVEVTHQLARIYDGMCQACLDAWNAD